MSAVGFPVPTKRSLRFKRFSWNKASDGSFPPIADNMAGNLKASNAKEPSDPKSMSKLLYTASSAGIQSQAKPKPNDVGPSLIGGSDQQQSQIQSQSLIASTSATNGSAKDQSSNVLADGEEMLAGSVVKGLQSRNANDPSGTYLGPFWDDEAGSLPTSTTTNDLDFDSLLSQMVKDT
ncbi:hypothetical protein FB645_001279 [Coemansia sp. IMI 203386]|nr:hypothetical protein FB645_001279 [Coemansia sp. IMI 203386]